MRLQAGAPTTFIEPVTIDNSVYKVFTKSSKNGDWSCQTPDDELESSITDRMFSNPENLDADDQIMRDFRLALSCTGEYTQYHGGTVAGALAAMNATMTRVNPILERDLGTHLTIIENNADVIFTSASSDPYSSASGMDAWNQQLQNTLTNTIGEANYDIGHLFGATGGGGNAGCIGCVCVNGSKGSAYTSPSNGQPEGDTFDIDYVIHEMGHQLGATHTFSRSEGTGTNYEPGSGSTIMGYAGITGGATDVQQHSDDYFHTGSVSQVTANIKNKTCPTEISLNNQTPTADAGPDYTIPVGTPFKLTGSATDADAGDELTYTWEQTNSSSNFSGFTTANPNITTGPLFRSFPPSTNPVRYFPAFDKVLAGTLSTPFESVSNVARNTNFTLQVRDNSANGGQTMSDEVRVGVTANGGVFYVTGPEANASVASGAELNVTWNVAGTTNSPVNVANVDILLSTDGGESFTMVAASTANDGSETITIPEGSTSEEARIMVRSVGNIFYAVSQEFYVDYVATVDCNEYNAIGLPRNIADGSAGGYGAFAVGQFTVPDLGPVDEIRVAVDVTHSWVGDLQIVFQTPAPAQGILLWDRNCNTNQTTTQNINAVFTDSGTAPDCTQTPVSGNIMPNELLSQFNGLNTQGNWLIGVRDGAAQDTGTFNSATATFCSVTLAPMGTADVNQNTMAVKVYPNPSNGKFNISMDLESAGVALGVFDVTGKLIHSFKDSNASGTFTHELNLGKTPAGVYILQVQTGNQIISKKLIVK